jgi:hypothetical protein
METYVEDTTPVSGAGWPEITPFITLVDADTGEPEKTLFGVIHVTEGPMSSAGNPVKFAAPEL